MCVFTVTLESLFHTNVDIIGDSKCYYWINLLHVPMFHLVVFFLHVYRWQLLLTWISKAIWWLSLRRTCSEVREEEINCENRSSWIPLEWTQKSSKGKRPHLTTRNTEEAELAMDKLRPWERGREGGCSSPFALAERGTLTLGRLRLSGIPPGFAIVTMAGKRGLVVWLFNSEYGSNGQCDRRRNIWTTTITCTDSLVTASIDCQTSVGE